MKNNYFIKVLIFFLAILFTAVGCGGKSSKNKDLFLDIKLNRVSNSDSNVSINKYTFHGYYEGCNGKIDKSAWILNRNEKIANLAVREKDKNCKLNITNFFINTVKYTLKTGANSTYTINSSNVIVFENENNKADLKFVTAKIFPDDFSKTPYIDIEINSKRTEKISSETAKSIGEIFGIDTIKLTSSASLSLTVVNRPEYTSDFSAVRVGFTRNGRSWFFGGNFTLNLDYGGQKANKYFFIINNNINTHNYSEVDSFFRNNKDNSEKVKTLSSNELSRISFSPAYLNNLTAAERTEKGQYMYIRLVLVNSVGNSSSYSVYGLNLKRSEN